MYKSICSVHTERRSSHKGSQRHTYKPKYYKYALAVSCCLISNCKTCHRKEEPQSGTEELITDMDAKTICSF